MNDILKQRLVGALILVALGVVFWPIIFVEPGSQPVAEQARMPPRPQVDTTPIEPPDQVGLRPARAVTARAEMVEVDVPLPDPAPEPLAVEPEPEPEPKPEPKPVQPATAPPASPTREVAPERLAMDSQGVPIAWILQVVSVSSADKAEQLRQQLVDKDRKAYTRKISSNGKTLYRVYVGPKFERARLESLKTEVDKEFGVNSMIVRYIP